jgi:V-type H+-transporting ATPase subunit a
LQNQLREITRLNDSKLSANFYDIIEEADTLNPPTFIKTNDFTGVFQQIVDTYGIPRYREINPALFNIVTFPFLFGVMFGDIGHGLLLFLGALYLVQNNDEIIKTDSPLKVLSKARYLFLFMGFFAFYCGWMYNDFLSLPVGIFGTCYDNDGEEAVIKPENKGCVYPFGLDPKWYSASNELQFFNSLKMKFAVIIGVIQMLFGIVLRGMNSLHFGNKLDFVCEFIPQIIFMGLLFGYMNIMIFMKWATEWTDTSKAPSIITQLMQIFLAGGSVVIFFIKDRAIHHFGMIKLHKRIFTLK